MLCQQSIAQFLEYALLLLLLLLCDCNCSCSLTLNVLAESSVRQLHTSSHALLLWNAKITCTCPGHLRYTASKARIECS